MVRAVIAFLWLIASGLLAATIATSEIAEPLHARHLLHRMQTAFDRIDSGGARIAAVGDDSEADAVNAPVSAPSGLLSPPTSRLRPFSSDSNCGTIRLETTLYVQAPSGDRNGGNQQSGGC
jgi:hypothetical protein